VKAVLEAFTAMTRTGPETVQAVIVGPLAVYPALDSFWMPERRRPYTIAHRTTGYAITSKARTKAQALSAARKLAKLHIWDFNNPDHVKAWPKVQVQQIFEIVRESQK
jgi:hypothetical protein